MSRLRDIFAARVEDLDRVKHQHPLTEVRRLAEQSPPPRDFLTALHPQDGRVAIVAEIKRASPSRGILRADLDVVDQARLYEAGGAVAVSVLTEPRFFQGDLEDLSLVARTIPLPVLRKDFIFDPYQLYEARAAGASAVLLIASYLDRVLLQDLMALTQTLGMTALVEIHTVEDLEKSLHAGLPRLIGINNRNLHDFSVSLDTTITLRHLIPAGIRVIAESGIHTREDIQRLRSVGVDAFLIGEVLVLASNPVALLRELRGEGSNHGG
ncbi:indole-3-glycerol phosphate synthase TrpC [Thermanaerothrix sp. 4228-RoL]|uniref:Indole-3-glycerol phosphate synthase n=1 Tax=Thermanaerothrix solaris TaxID=3058434 RepID=A0ABU3NRR0_9CHLR|nr:indole-3-glycerol phosphate synthase TrpC [Thermanaerothrix sp. 4228-RoL]MDT8899050.1 indole-3-glycerol phosphate synthase TrpC [Thermanaerothrix sp. 4228-RoL]